jgi:hypothetical protein
MRHAPYRHIVRMEGGGELHTRKGWRGLARPRKTNARTKLTKLGASAVLLSSAYHATIKSPARSLWGRLKGYAVNTIATIKEQRLAREREEIAKALAAAQAAAAGASGA